jgi:tetraacyldisaccharide-1-P 4'-kinase
VSIHPWQARLVRRLWRRRSWKARAARAVLLPLSGLYAGIVSVRAAWYRGGLARVRSLPLPAVAVGNLSVGGTGKTPLAAWIAARLVSNGRRPGILLRGYGRTRSWCIDDSCRRYRGREPRPGRGGAAAQAQGADVLVLDDAFQLLNTRRDLNIAVLAAEQARLPRWTLPAGPWREGIGALARADLLVVTRKRADAEAAAALAARLTARWPRKPVAVARLSVTRLAGMRTGTPMSLDLLRGRSVLAAAAIADPESLRFRCGRPGRRCNWRRTKTITNTTPPTWPAGAGCCRRRLSCGHRKRRREAAHALAGRRPEPLVAVMEWIWERNRDVVERALERVVAASTAGTSNLTDNRI